MSTRDMVLVQVEIARDKKGLINIDEIAAMEEHIVTSYTYQEWTLVTLKSGKQIDVHESASSLVGRIERALDKPVVNAR